MGKEENRDVFDYLEKEMMSHGTISGSETCFLLCPKLPTKSNPQNCSGLVFSPNLVIKQSKSIKFPCGLHRGRTRAAINGLYGVKQANLYEVLGVSEKGTASEIKKAYKKLALKYHPDLSPPDRAAEYTSMFIEVQEAYETLSDPKARAMYDGDLGSGLQLAYSRSRRSHNDQVCTIVVWKQKFEGWRDRWQSQLIELNRMSDYKDSMRRDHEVPWGVGLGSRRSHRFCPGFNN